ncbi:hypothetical protein [Roseicyclus elongatus]|uniref:hypothetical protein n=1 Tax=Roseicyclus elongatus TaxID=159346 RepID=UPI0004AE5F70|nr:hypothetical protein [Roseibacterium elongatum]
MTALSPVPDFVKTAQASRAWARRVTLADEVPAAIDAALTAIDQERRLALLDIATQPDTA